MLLCLCLRVKAFVYDPCVCCICCSLSFAPLIIVRLCVCKYPSSNNNCNNNNNTYTNVLQDPLPTLKILLNTKKSSHTPQMLLNSHFGSTTGSRLWLKASNGTTDSYLVMQNLPWSPRWSSTSYQHCWIFPWLKMTSSSISPQHAILAAEAATAPNIITDRTNTIR